MCFENAQAAQSQGRHETARVWQLSALILDRSTLTLSDHRKERIKCIKACGALLVKRLFSYLESIGDIQTLVMLTLVFQQSETHSKRKHHRILSITPKPTIDPFLSPRHSVTLYKSNPVSSIAHSPGKILGGAARVSSMIEPTTTGNAHSLVFPTTMVSSSYTDSSVRIRV